MSFTIDFAMAGQGSIPSCTGIQYESASRGAVWINNLIIVLELLIFFFKGDVTELKYDAFTEMSYLTYCCEFQEKCI